MSNTANDFIARHSLAFRCERIEKRPDDLGCWQLGARHFRVEFRTLARDFALVTYFSQGSAHTKDPTAAEVLECLASDARAFEDVEDVLGFAREFGYDLDALKGEERCRAAYNGCRKTHHQLGALLTVEGREELMGLDFEDDC